MAMPATAPAEHYDAPTQHDEVVHGAPAPLAPSRPTSDFVYATMLLGIPGSMFTAFATLLLMMGYGEGAQMGMWVGIATLWTAYFGVMAAGWLAQANE